MFACSFPAVQRGRRGAVFSYVFVTDSLQAWLVALKVPLSPVRCLTTIYMQGLVTGMNLLVGEGKWGSLGKRMGVVVSRETPAAWKINDFVAGAL